MGILHCPAAFAAAQAAAQQKTLIREWVTAAVVEVADTPASRVTDATPLPANRCRLMWLILRHTENCGFCPYTGEAVTVGHLIDVLTDPNSLLRWKEAGIEPNGGG